MASPPPKHRVRAPLLGSLVLGSVLGLTSCGQLTGGGVTSVAYTPDGRLVAFGNDAIHVFDADARRQIQSFSTPWEFAWIPVPPQMALSADGNTVAVGNGKAVDVYDLASGSRRAHIPVNDAPEESAPIAGITLSHDGVFVAVAVRPIYYGAPRLGIWSVADQALVADAQLPLDRKYWPWGAGLAFSLDGQILYALLTDSDRSLPKTYVTSWNAADGSPLAENAIFSDPVNGIFGSANLLALSPDGTTLATAGSELLRWEAATLAFRVGNPSPTVFGTNSLAFSPDGRDLVTTHATNSAPDPQIVGPDGNLVRSWPVAESGGCESAAFSPDGTRVAAACAQWLRIWDVATGEAVQARRITSQVY